MSLPRKTLLLALILMLPVLALAGPKKLPRIQVTDLDGKKHDFQEFLIEGPVLLNFWATWCKPCLAELPKIEEFHEEWAGRGLQLITVSIDDAKTQKQVKPFVHRHGFEFPVYTDPNQEAFRKLGGRAVPFNVLIDTDGTILDAHFGFRPKDPEKWGEILLELLGPAPSEESADE